METLSIGDKPLEGMMRFCQKHYGPQGWEKIVPKVEPVTEEDAAAAKEMGKVMANSFIDELGKLGMDENEVREKMGRAWDNVMTSLEPGERIIEKARALIHDIEEALAAGYKHYDGAGNELTTVGEVLDTLRREGTFTIKKPEGEDGK